MKRNNFFSRFILVTLTAALLLVSGSRAIRVSALAVGPLADPVYDTEIIAFKDYVEQNLDAPQLDIMFFLIGGLAVAQMGAQDALLISPYPNEENVKEWIINCGIQLYNAVIGLVPEGDYYMGIPSIGTAVQKGVPRQVIKALVAQMMGDAVVAINYPDLDTFLEENPDKILLPFTQELQLGVNAVFGLNGGIGNWQSSSHELDFTTTIPYTIMSGVVTDSYNSLKHTLTPPLFYATPYASDVNRIVSVDALANKDIYLFYDTDNSIEKLVFSDGTQLNSAYLYGKMLYYNGSQALIFNGTNYGYLRYSPQSVSASGYDDIADFMSFLYNRTSGLLTSLDSTQVYLNFVSGIYAGIDWEHRIEIKKTTTLNIDSYNDNYYDSVQTDYLFDLRGLMGDLVNYIYTNPIWDNIYDLVGNLTLPDRIKVSVDLTPITDLLAPPVPVNLNDIAELTDNTYLERVKEHARNAGDIFANYVAFWHNCDSDLVYTMFGAVILVLVGAFVGKWGHS